MRTLHYTLVSDGSSDSTLLSVIDWLLNDLYPNLPIKGEYADFRGLNQRTSLSDVKKRILCAKAYYPFDICVYHRDAEKNDINQVHTRRNEILSQLEEPDRENIVCLVPVRMMETWFLTDELAIRKAASNPNGKVKLKLPKLNKLETISDSKDVLHNLLKCATGNKNRHLKHFNVEQAVHYVAENTEDYSKLRSLNAFKIFEEDLKEKVDAFLNCHSRNE